MDAQDAAAANPERAEENGFRDYGPERPPGRNSD
ncbi:MAG: hypothetical protein K0S86_920 [Geminicoccaceae bacterium]|jgi:hypothetical protein|nr:hypothetical protein [Geminicoccaceae bacterium]